MTKTPGVNLLTNFTCVLVLRNAHRPQQAPIVLPSPGGKFELNSYLWVVRKAEFPELVGNILSGVGRCAVAPDKDLIA